MPSPRAAAPQFDQGLRGTRRRARALARDFAERRRGAVRVYDTSGPQGFKPTDGLPKLRAPWIEARKQRGDTNFS
ncbi:hypothetical protein KDL45_10215, partial [bacterium]|nr:hypothetical protein [bacterium]